MLYLQSGPRGSRASTTISRKKRWVRSLRFRGPPCINISSERQSPRSVTPRAAAAAMTTPSGGGDAATTYYDVYGPDVRALSPSLLSLLLFEGSIRISDW